MHSMMGKGLARRLQAVMAPPTRRWAPAVAAGLVLLGACHGAPAGSGAAIDAAHVRAQQARDLARQAGLGPDIQSFLGRAAGAGASTFTVVYDLGGGRRSIVMQRPPDRRVDLQGLGGPRNLDRYVFTRSGTFSCHRDEHPWSCQRGGDAPPIGAFSADTIGQSVAALSQATSSYDFTLQSRQIARLPASCLVTTLKQDHVADPSLGIRGTLCIAPSGAILAIESAANSVAAIRYSSSVPAGAFDLPAKVGA